MSETSFLLEVPASEAADLSDLAVADMTLLRGSGLDGTAVVTALLSATPATVVALRAWLNARVEQRKAATVVLDGRRFSGYTAGEVVRILAALEGTESRSSEGEE